MMVHPPALDEPLTELLVRERRPLPTPVTVAVRASVACALLFGAIIAYTLWFSTIPQARAQEDLYDTLRAHLSDATAPLGGDIEPGTPVAVLEGPSIGLRQVVVEGTASTVMWAGPGHRRNTPLPGQPGVSVIYGHSAAYGAPFERIIQLHPGDPLLVTTGQGQFTYHVATVRRANDPLPAQLGSGHGQLTLVTAEGGGWRDGWSPDQVVYVDALLEGDTQLGPPGRPTTVDTAEKVMQGDPDALVPLLLWLMLIVAAALATTWARVRWGGPQVWIVGVPVLLAGFWGVLESVAQLLPNLS